MSETIVSIGLLVIYCGYIIVNYASYRRRIDAQDRILNRFMVDTLKELDKMQEDINELKSTIYIGVDGK